VRVGPHEGAGRIRRDPLGAAFDELPGVPPFARQPLEEPAVQGLFGVRFVAEAEERAVSEHAQSSSKPAWSNLRVLAFSPTVRTVDSSNPPGAVAVISRRTSSCTPSTAARFWITS